jgi:branched-chain amino acid transport system ATP-binding protein
MSAALLEVRALESGYGKLPVLYDVSMTVGPLETVCVLGANGAGKTTLVSTIAGVLPPSRGRIVFDGQDVTGLKPERLAQRGLSLVRQGRSVFPHMTVAENLEMGAYLLRDSAEIRKRRDIVFDMFPVLRERQHQLAGSMSGGEQKMLEIGRSLMCPLKLLILDEPSLGLAPIVVQSIFERIREFKHRGLTVLLVEQNAFAALDVSARGYVLELGHIRLEDTSDRLRANSDIRAAYLGVAPGIDGDR